jgi:hypothetical protein
MANVEQMRRAMRIQPFRGFNLKLVDGTIYSVHHPDWLSIPPVRRPREITFYNVVNKENDEYETHWIDLGLILEVIVPCQVAAAPAQGERDGV